VVIYVFSVRLKWLPAQHVHDRDGSLIDYLHHLIAPALVLALSRWRSGAATCARR